MTPSVHLVEVFTLIGKYEISGGEGTLALILPLKKFFNNTVCIPNGKKKCCYFPLLNNMCLFLSCGDGGKKSRPKKEAN